MCLSVVYRGKAKKEALAKLPESFYVWKVMDKFCGRFVTYFRDMPLHGGEVQFKTNIVDDFDGLIYRGGGHFWRREKSALSQIRRLSFRKTLVRCRAKKSDITSIGLQDDGQVIVLKKAIFPKWVGEAG